MQDYVNRREAAIKKGLGVIAEKKAGDSHPMQVVLHLGQLIRYNKDLQSINLSNTGLNAQVLAGLVPSLRHAKSLLCLHLTSNPGISPTLYTYYMERLKILPEYVLKI